MCGIAGVISLENNNKVNVDQLKAMNRVQQHRGPDAEGYYDDDSVALAHRRLSIIDVSSGQQPMASADDKLVIVFNGEIYNFIEVRDVLISKGHSFLTDSDTEVILLAYKEWGVDCLQFLTGMFAFALYDKAAQTVFFARDRIGEKPLFLSCIEDKLFFASELKSLQAHPRFNQQLNPQALEDYLTLGYVPETKSIFASVSKLLPAHYMVIKVGQASSLKQVKYWDIPTQQANTSFDPEDLYRELEKRVSERLMSEVPLGAFLSGGVDSSAIVAAMANTSGSAPTTCSIGFDVPEYNESDFAKAVADRYSTNHKLEVVDHEDLDLVDKLIDWYDEPFADSSALPTFKVCELARKHVTVALSGDAGDELFAGYRRYRFHNNECIVRNVTPRWMRKLIFKPLGIIYPKADWAPKFLRAKTTFQSLALDDFEGYQNSVSKIRQDTRFSLYQKSFSEKLRGYKVSSLFGDIVKDKSFEDPIKQAQYIDFKTWMPSDILVKVDRVSMANSLEVRVPMLDHGFIEKYFSLPSENNMEGDNLKASLKKAMEPHLPLDNLYRNKMGFSIPLDEWMRGPLAEKAKTMFNSEKLKTLAIFSTDELNKLLNAHINNKANWGAELWTIFVFCLFVEKNNVHW